MRPVLVLQTLPHRGRALANAFLGDEFARECRHDIVVFLHSS
jgi:hypothetical protein